jgi:hypothetical protein
MVCRPNAFRPKCFRSNDETLVAVYKKAVRRARLISFEFELSSLRRLQKCRFSSFLWRFSSSERLVKKTVRFSHWLIWHFFFDKFLFSKLSFYFQNNCSKTRLKLAGPITGRVYNSGSGYTFATRLMCSVAKLSSLELKIRHKQLLDFTLPGRGLELTELVLIEMCFLRSWAKSS